MSETPLLFDVVIEEGRSRCALAFVFLVPSERQHDEGPTSTRTLREASV